MLNKIIDSVVNILAKYEGLRYFLAGGSAGVTDLIALYILHDFFGIYYLFSAVIAFIIAFIQSFTLHKFWTFKSHEQETHKQVMMYFGTSMFGLTLNTMLMYIFVDHLHMGVFVSQIIVGLMVACVSFFISRNIVFKFNKEKYEASSIFPKNR